MSQPFTTREILFHQPVHCAVISYSSLVPRMQGGKIGKSSANIYFKNVFTFTKCLHKNDRFRLTSN